MISGGTKCTEVLFRFFDPVQRIPLEILTSIIFSAIIFIRALTGQINEFHVFQTDRQKGGLCSKIYIGDGCLYCSVHYG